MSMSNVNKDHNSNHIWKKIPENKIKKKGST